MAEKTFLEKAFLLHELFSSQTSREANRKSRHLYDLAQMMSTDIATRAIANDELWNTIHHHRELFTSMSGVDYTPDIRKRIRLLPPDDVMDDWYNDYKGHAIVYDIWRETIVRRIDRKNERIRKSIS